MRKVVSLLMLYVMIVLTYTGAMLFIVPEGKVAYWVNWSMFGMTKSQFAQMHISFMILFVLITVLHLYYNWNPLINYLKNRSKEFIFLTKENLIAIAITFVFITGTLYTIEPFNTVFSFQKEIKQYWGDELGRPPYGHAELTSFKKFCKRMGYDKEEALEALKEDGIIVKNEKDNLKKIASYNNIIPAKIYDVIFDALE